MKRVRLVSAQSTASAGLLREQFKAEQQNEMQRNRSAAKAMGGGGTSVSTTAVYARPEDLRSYHLMRFPESGAEAGGTLKECPPPILSGEDDAWRLPLTVREEVVSQIEPDEAEARRDRKRRPNETEEEFQIRKRITHETQKQWVLEEHRNEEEDDFGSTTPRQYVGKEETAQTLQYVVLIPDIERENVYKVARIHQWINMSKPRDEKGMQEKADKIKARETARRVERRNAESSLKTAENAALQEGRGATAGGFNWGSSAKGGKKRSSLAPVGGKMTLVLGEADDGNEEDGEEDDDGYGGRTALGNLITKNPDQDAPPPPPGDERGGRRGGGGGGRRAKRKTQDEMDDEDEILVADRLEMDGGKNEENADVVGDLGEEFDDDDADQGELAAAENLTGLEKGVATVANPYAAGGVITASGEEDEDEEDLEDEEDDEGEEGRLSGGPA